MNFHAEPKYENPLLSIINIWAERVINSENQYSGITKLFAILYNQIRGSYPVNQVSYPSERYDMKDLLYSLIVSDYSQLPTQISRVRNNYYQLLERSHFRSLDKLIDLIKEGLFFEMIIRKWNIAPTLFTEDLINRIIEALDTWNKEEHCTLIKLFKSTFLSQPTEDSGEINFNDFDEIELALLSHLFFEKYITSGNYRALYNHYKSIEVLIKRLKESTSIIDAPSDETLRMLFKVATILHLTGYSDSLSLPSEERLKYINSMLMLPPLRYIFEKKVENATRIGFEIREIPLLNWDLENPIRIKIPLYMGIAIFMVLSSIPVFVNANILNITLSWEFYALYYTAGAILTYKAFKLTKDIIKALWGE
ncbi:hypothetical protein [Palaeococcus sp. (in: euryarchaeotes)]